ncbi:lipopolysaccharide-induced tumor necrosis factor-alpha factor homolog [Montipora foliosa]|uniref:lipopolysaccharide-induced tumor necrosis factor-alpha factor homolog n=1 Tax=Montipora foliosa TaxID=591990 RepID=UPI0035F18B68
MSDKPPPYQGPPVHSAYPTQPGYPQGYPPAQPGYQPGYPPGQPGYPTPPAYGAPPQMPQHTTTTTVVQQPPTAVVIGNAMYGESPVSMVCPYCNATIVTSVTYSPGTLAWLACLGLVLVGCGAGCCLIPFCIDGMQDAVHTCPNCHRQLGAYRRM